jgi:hypothetical protein
LRFQHQFAQSAPAQPGATCVPAISVVHQNLHEGGVLLACKALAPIAGEPVASDILPTDRVVRAT